ncbi:Major facilitator superfamily, partial [Globisporangium splendens]
MPTADRGNGTHACASDAAGQEGGALLVGRARAAAAQVRRAAAVQRSGARLHILLSQPVRAQEPASAALQRHAAEGPSLLYTVYSTPNVVLPFFGGLLVDKFGAQQMLLVLTTLVLAGQTVLAIGSSMSSFRIMLLGRIIFGFGGESLGVARTTFIATWFKKRELGLLSQVFSSVHRIAPNNSRLLYDVVALALGISNSFSGFASILNNLLSPYFADRFGASFALWFGACMCALSVVATLVLVPLDKSARAKNPYMLPNGKPMLETKKPDVKISDIKHFSMVFWMILVASVSIWGSVVPFQTVAGSILLERDFFRHPPPTCRRCGEGNYASYTDCHEIVPSCPAFPPYAWPLPNLSASCKITRVIDQLYCNTDPPFIADSEINCDNPIWRNGPKTQLFCEKKIIAERSASRVMSLPSLISLFASPLSGFGIDHAGNRGVIAIGSSFLVATSQLGIAVSNMSIWVLLFVQGVSSCLYFAAIWPSIPYVVEEHHVGSAYGAIIALGNLVLAILPMGVAAVYRIDERYLPNVQILLGLVGCCAFIASCLLYRFDQMDGRVLNPPTPRILTKAQAVARSFDESDYLLDFHDYREPKEVARTKSARGKKS